jgi:hypothetical protein
MKSGQFIIILLFILTIGACETIDKNFEVVNGKFKVGYIGEKKDSIVMGYHAERGMMAIIIPPRVRRIGGNDKFLIAERIKTFAPDSINKRYYIINMDMFKNPNSGTGELPIYGPFDFTTFLEKKKELNIEELDFNKEI